MSKILIICEQKFEDSRLAELFDEMGYEVRTASSEKETYDVTNEFLPDIAILDTSCAGINTSVICKKLKLNTQASDVQIILLTSKDSPTEELLAGADGYIIKPFNDSILIATVNAHLRIKKLLDILYTNNSELARSLYQLNVLYNTSSQLAGTLDKSKLIKIMNTGLEKSLNFCLCLGLITNGPEDATLIINSNQAISEKLEHSLKMRVIIGYKSLFETKKLPFELSVKNLKVEKHIKNKKLKYDLDVLRYDSLFSPISTSDKFFGTVEILRNNDFTGEDSTCFQTVVKQVSLPLESALLYEEIKNTNLKLEKLEKLKSEFISIVSHELRTPLTAIKNSLDIMLSGKTGIINETQDNFLSMAKRNVERLSGIINDLLDLSKIEAGKMQYRFDSYNPTEPIDFAFKTFENLANKKNIRLTKNIKPKLPQIYCDISKIEQVLSNLLSNAIKFTPEGGKIEISAEEIPAEKVPAKFIPETAVENSRKILRGNYVKISVKDTGIGIKEEDIPKVFDKFQQIESSLNREIGGTGLGIPIAKQLIDAHRGAMWLESKPMQGSKFSFIIPVTSNENRLLLEIDSELQNSKFNHSSFALVLIEESTGKGSGKKAVKSDHSFIKDIAENKFSFVKDDLNSKVFANENKLVIIIPNADKTGNAKIEKKIKTFIKEQEYDFKNSKVRIGFCIYPYDAISGEEMIEYCSKSSKLLR